jgi:hypothetical protein
MQKIENVKQEPFSAPSNHSLYILDLDFDLLIPNLFLFKFFLSKLQSQMGGSNDLFITKIVF